MKIYDIIADNYDQIFPLGEDRLDFVKSLLKPKDKLLDIGCGTGALCIEMAKAGYRSSGIDLNSKMIEIARQEQTQNADFQIMDMSEIEKHFAKTDFSLISSFGNTLPHLDSLEKMADFFRQVHSCLTPDGHFVFQILNYDKILRQGKCDFPEIKTRNFIFTRKYEFLEGKIGFTIELAMGGKKMSDTTLLFPLKKEAALSLLNKAGFREIHSYKNYQLNPADGGEFATLYAARK
ncbi:MAG: class I SAM-dependent methyltransferase [Spirochaetales bacterium]|nr:class I SAM-dependent methyltransferase [Spirochaetales bacterium]